MKNLYFFLLSCFMLTAVQAAASKCGGTLVNNTGSFMADAASHSNCVWYIVRSVNETDTSVRLLASLGGKSNGTLSVYAGNSTAKKSGAKLIKEYTGKFIVDDMLISKDKITTVVYNGQINNTGQITGSYSTEECTWQISGPFAEFKAPEYLPGKGSITCDYTLSWIDKTYTPILAFSMVNLKDGHLVVNPEGENITVSGTKLHEDIILNGDKNMTLKLSIENGNKSQGFKAAFSQGNADCTRVTTVNSTNSYNIITLPFMISYPFDCRIIVKSEKNTTMQVSMAFLKLTGGDDSLTFLDGGSQNAPALSRFDATSPPDYLFVTSGNELWMRIKLDETTKERFMSVIVFQQSEGGRFTSKSGAISLPVLKGTHYVPIFFQVVVPEGQVKLDFTKFVKKCKGCNITVYDGSVPDPKLTTIFSEDDFFTITSSGSTVLIQANGFGKGDSFKATYTTAVEGCDKYSTGNDGLYKMTTSTKGQVCNWNIKSLVSNDIAGTLALNVKSVTFCPGSSIAVYDGITKKGKRLAFLKSDMNINKLPVIYVSNSNGVRLSLTSGNCSGTATNTIQAGYILNTGGCGGSLSQLAGTVTSPLYPDQYPLNTRCTWNFIPGKMPLIFMTIDQVQLGANHSLVLNKIFDLAKFSKQDIVLRFNNKSMGLVFDSRNPADQGAGVDKVGQGFKLNYERLNCGGYISNKNSGVIKMPKLSANISVQRCVWIIKLQPTKKVKILSLNVNTTGHNPGDILTIYDGGSTKSKVLNLKKNNKTQTLTGESRTDIIVVQYVHTFLLESTKNGTKFNFTVNFKSLECNKTCQNGLCLHPSWLCNGVNDCGDNTDEIHCSGIPVTTPKPNPSPLTPAANTKGMVKSYLVAITAIICLCLGVAIALAIPAIYKRWKYPNYRQLSDMNVTA